MLRSLRVRLAVSFLLIVLVTLAAAGVTLYTRLDSYRDDLTRSTLRQVAAPIYFNLTLFTPGESQRPGQAAVELRRELNAYLEVQSSAGIMVFPVDANGSIIADDSTGLPQEAQDGRFVVPPAPARGPDFSELPLQQYTTGDGDRLVYVSVPTTRLIRAQRDGIYAIVVAMPETSRRDVFRDLLGRLIVAGGAGLLAATVAVVVLGLWVYRPLGKVARGVRAVAAGDFSERVAEGGPAEVRRLARDVNSMADAVQNSQTTLREFLANVSHELKTPLTSIRGFSQAMLDGTIDTPDERARAARVIDAESRRVLHLVGELLDLSRIESGQQKMNLADVRVDELLSHIDDVFSLRSVEAGIDFHVRRVPANVGTPEVVAADFDRLEQVLGNLIDNAFRHTPRGGHIEAGTRDAGAFVEFYVADSGTGIAPEDLPHVFDRFYRSQLGEPDLPGAGLGLAIAREIVRAHGGSILAAARPDGGTEFSFTVPRAAAAERSSGESRAYRDASARGALEPPP